MTGKDGGNKAEKYKMAENIWRKSRIRKTSCRKTGWRKTRWSKTRWRKPKQEADINMTGNKIAYKRRLTK